MQWRRQRKITHVIGSSNHVLLLARYQDAPPGEEDEEDGIRNSYAKVVENGAGTRNGQPGHKSGRTDSAGSTTSDYASDYTSAASRSRRDDSGGSPSQPKIIFNENEYTRITTPRQDVLFKKGYLSRKKVWASTASTSATPSTTESQSASHSTAVSMFETKTPTPPDIMVASGDEFISTSRTLPSEKNGSEEDQRLLDCKENGAEDYREMGEPDAQVAYGTFYDHASGYYYEYPVMVVGPGGGMPGPPMHNVLTAVPCGPVPLRPIEWVNPAFVPKYDNQQYCVMDYQTTHLGQYPTLVDESGIPLTAPPENTNGCDETCLENGTGSASWSGSVADEEPNGDDKSPQNDTKNGETEIVGDVPANGDEQPPETALNSEVYLENALVQQLHVTHVAAPPVPQPYMYPGHYMFGPSLVNVNGVTIQSGPMVRNTGVTGGPANTGAYAKRRKKKKLSKRKSRRPVGPGNAEDEEQEEEEEYSSGSENPAAALSQTAVASEPGPAGVPLASVPTPGDKSLVTTSSTSRRPLNPECKEFRPTLESRIIPSSVEATTTEASTSLTNSEPSSSAESSDNRQPVADLAVVENDKTSIEANDQESTKTRVIENSTSTTPDDSTKNDRTSRPEKELEAAPVEFAAEVFANVTTIAERALASRGVVEGTPMETEIGLDATSVNFREIVENVGIMEDVEPQVEDSAITTATGNGRRRIEVEEDVVPNGQKTVEVQERCREKSSVQEVAISAGASETNSKRQRAAAKEPQRCPRSASPGMINRTTTPINAKSQRLPDSYESLVIRGSNGSSSSSSTVATASSAQQAIPRNRKYSTKTPKFVREATPGPDLDVTQLQTQTLQCSSEQSEPSEFIRMKILKPEGVSSRGASATTGEQSARTVSRFDDNADEAIATGIEALEAEVQRYSLSTTESCSYSGEKRDPNASNVSNDDSGVESQRYSSDHPITDAVTEWLQRANSPELFVTSTMVSDDEPEDDEPDDIEPSKNLEGNPMPALSANVSDANDIMSSSRSASCGEFARINEAIVDSHVNVNNDTNKTNSCVSSRRRRRTIARRGSRKSSRKDSRVSGSEQKRDDSSSQIVQFGDVEKEVRSESSRQCNGDVGSVYICEFAENDSVAGMRVAESSRMKKIDDTTRSRVEGSRRSRSRDGSTVIALSGREEPVENVEVTVRRMIDDNDEGIVEDEEVSVRTFEKGEIVVSIEGKVLPVAAYEPMLLQRQWRDDDGFDEADERPKFSRITCERSRREETEETSTCSDEAASKRNSLGSIEEPDVLECWEVETVEPVTTPKRIAARGTSQEGEAAEDEQLSEVDKAGVEIVRKYYRLEATRDSGASVTSVDDCSNRDSVDIKRSSINDSPERTIESLCSEEIPVIGERMSKIVENFLNETGIPIEEAAEVYESCYHGKSHLVGFDTRLRHTGRLFGQDQDRDGAVPCKAACCNIQ